MPSIEEAFQRYERLRALLRKSRRDLRARPLDELAHELGLVATGQDVQEVRRVIDRTFDDFDRRNESVGFLDVVLAFEDWFRLRFATLVGEVRKSIRSGLPPDVVMARFGERAVLDTNSLNTLKAIENFVQGMVANDLLEALAIIREQRNRLAHTAGWNEPLRVTVRQARDNLAAILEAIR